MDASDFARYYSEVRRKNVAAHEDRKRLVVALEVFVRQIRQTLPEGMSCEWGSNMFGEFQAEQSNWDQWGNLLAVVVIVFGGDVKENPLLKVPVELKFQIEGRDIRISTAHRSAVVAGREVLTPELFFHATDLLDDKLRTDIASFKGQ